MWTAIARLVLMCFPTHLGHIKELIEVDNLIKVKCDPKRLIIFAVAVKINKSIN